MKKPSIPLSLRMVLSITIGLVIFLTLFNPKTATSENLKINSVVDSVLNSDFVLIKGGCFVMGSLTDEIERVGDEFPHQVCVDSFYLAKYEVTNRQYRVYKPNHNSGFYKGIPLNNDDQPVVKVSWFDVREYINWLNTKNSGPGRFRLPTEAEWEFAARAGSQTSNYWHDIQEQACEFASLPDFTAKKQWPGFTLVKCDDGYLTTSPVGSFLPNLWGLYDMLGNVMEWTADYYDENYYAKSPKKNPIGPKNGQHVVARGGAWYSTSEQLRFASRGKGDPNMRAEGVGFRLVWQR